MTLREVGRLFKEAGVKFWGDSGPRLGAALAFYTAVSLSPLLLAVVAIAGLAFGEEAARGEIVEQIHDVVGQEAATVIEQLVLKSANKSDGIAAAVIAFAVLLFGASGVFAELQGALNAVWKVPGRKHEGGIWSFVKNRLLSFSLVCGTAFLLLVSLVVSAILAAVQGKIAGWMPGMDVLAQVLNFLLSLALTTLLFAMIFQWLPETDLAWSDVWVGAAVTALLFAIGRYLIGLYLGRAAVGSAYGAAGAFVVLLVWIYYSTQILLFGAELTFVYATRYGSGVQKVPPSPEALPGGSPEPSPAV
jgi:membrane protein